MLQSDGEVHRESATVRDKRQKDRLPGKHTHTKRERDGMEGRKTLWSRGGRRDKIETGIEEEIDRQVMA